jgi:hypothetical protein
VVGVVVDVELDELELLLEVGPPALVEVVDVSSAQAGAATNANVTMPPATAVTTARHRRAPLRPLRTPPAWPIPPGPRVHHTDPDGRVVTSVRASGKQGGLPTHVAPQSVGDHDGPIRLLAMLDDRRPHPRRGQGGSVE